MRKHGLTIDQLISVDLVTADGELVTASESENADLFWGVRGGGGNFGIVDRVRVPAASRSGPSRGRRTGLLADGGRPEVLRFYRDWIADCPDELMTIVVQRQGSRPPVVPAELRRRARARVRACYAGPVEDGEEVCPAEAVRPPRARPVPAEAVRRPPGDVRSRPSCTAGGITSAPATCIGLSDEVIDAVRRARPSDRSPITEHRALAAGRGGRARRRGRDGLQRPQGRLHLQHQRQHKTADGFEAERAVGARLLVRARALPHRAST